VNNFISQEVLHGQALRAPDLRSASLCLSQEQRAQKEKAFFIGAFRIVQFDRIPPDGC